MNNREYMTEGKMGRKNEGKDIYVYACIPSTKLSHVSIAGLDSCPVIRTCLRAFFEHLT
jgi:hypothetical protein